MKLTYKDGKQRCRFCGHVINEGDKTTVHQVAEYRENDGKPWEERVHVHCDSNMPSSVIDIPKGYRRYKCEIDSPVEIVVHLDRGLNKEIILLDVPNLQQYKLSVIRDSNCIYFKNQLLIELPEYLISMHLDW